MISRNTTGSNKASSKQKGSKPKASVQYQAPATRVSNNLKPPVSLWIASATMIGIVGVVILLADLNSVPWLKSPWLVVIAMSVMVLAQWVVVRSNRHVLGWIDPEREQRREARKARLPSISQWTEILTAVTTDQGDPVEDARSLIDRLKELIRVCNSAVIARSDFEAAVRAAAESLGTESGTVSAEVALESLRLAAKDLKLTIALGEHLRLNKDDPIPKSVADLKLVVERVRPAIRVLSETEGDPVRSHTLLADLFAIVLESGESAPNSRKKVQELAKEWKRCVLAVHNDLPVVRADLDTATGKLRELNAANEALQTQSKTTEAAHSSEVGALNERIKQLTTLHSDAVDLQTVTAETLEEVRQELSAATSASDDLRQRVGHLEPFEAELQSLCAIDLNALAKQDLEAIFGTVGLTAYYIWFEQQRIAGRTKEFRNWLLPPVLKAMSDRRAGVFASESGIAAARFTPPFKSGDTLLTVIVEILQKCLHTKEAVEFVMSEAAKRCGKETRTFLKTILPEPNKLEVALPTKA